MQPFIAGLLTAGFIVLCVFSWQKPPLPGDECGLEWVCLLELANQYHPPKKHRH